MLYMFVISFCLVFFVLGVKIFAVFGDRRRGGALVRHRGAGVEVQACRGSGNTVHTSLLSRSVIRNNESYN